MGGKITSGVIFFSVLIISQWAGDYNWSLQAFEPICIELSKLPYIGEGKGREKESNVIIF